MEVLSKHSEYPCPWTPKAFRGRDKFYAEDDNGKNASLTSAMFCAARSPPSKLNNFCNNPGAMNPQMALALRRPELYYML